MRLSWVAVGCFPYIIMTGGCIGQAPIVTPTGGLLDLSKSNLGDKSVYGLHGEWLSVPNQFLTPRNNRDFAQNAGIYPLPAMGYGTYQLRINSPAGLAKMRCAISIPLIAASYRLYVNEALIGVVGAPGKTDNETKTEMRWASHAFDCPSGEFLVTLQISNFLTQNSFSLIGSYFGSAAAIARQYRLSLLRELFPVPALVLIGIFFLFSFFGARRDYSALALVLFTLPISLRCFFTESAFILEYFPSLPAAWVIRLRYLLALGGIVAALFFYRTVFTRELTTRALQIATIPALAYGLFIVASPVELFSHTIKLLAIYIAGCSFYLFGVVVVAWRNRSLGAKTFFVMSVAMIGAVINDLLVSLNLVNGVVVVGYAISVYVLAQAVLVTRRQNVAFAALDKFNEDLESKVIERTEQYKQATADAQKNLDAARAVAAELDRANAVKVEFISNMTHELKTPLNAIVGMSELALDSEQREEDRQRMKVIRISAETILTLVNDVLDFSRFEAGKLQLDPQVIDLPQLLRDTLGIVREMAHKKSIVLLEEYPSQLPQFIFCDGNRLRQVLLNLLSNALKFTLEGLVALRVEVENISENRARLTLHVIDSGIGIHPEAQSRIFQPFIQGNIQVQRHFGGTGLGLAISRKIINAMGGEISVDSMPEFGARFFFSIEVPIGSEAALMTFEKQELYHDVGREKLANLKILLAEDNEMNRKVAQQMLKKLEVTCDTACNGQEAVAYATAKKYDLILMDLQMPEMDGLEATKILRERGNRVKIVAMSANDSANDRETCLSVGMNGFLPKPVTISALRSLLMRRGIDPGNSNPLR